MSDELAGGEGNERVMNGGFFYLKFQIEAWESFLFSIETSGRWNFWRFSTGEKRGGGSLPFPILERMDTEFFFKKPSYPLSFFSRISGGINRIGRLVGGGFWRGHQV